MRRDVDLATPYERFMRNLAVIGAHRPDAGSWTAYERLRGEFQRCVPDATPEQHQAAMQAIAKAAGV